MNRRLYYGLAQYRRQVERLMAERAKNGEGYVYLVGSNVGYYKIGMTTNIHNRFRNLKNLLPYEMEVIALIYTEDMVAHEASIKSYFDAKHLKNEWFALSEEDVECFKQWANANYNRLPFTS